MTTTRPRDHYTFTSVKSQERIAIILAAIEQKPMTTAAISKLVDCRFSTGYRYLTGLRDSSRVYIAAWESSGPRSWLPMWMAGDAPDKPRPRLPSRDKKCPAHVESTPPLKSFSRTFVPQPVARDRSVEMFFGPAYVGLGAELRGMTA